MNGQVDDEQLANWNDAQSTISFSCDLRASASALLRLLASVDRHPCLYKGPAVTRAIYRYENCWLPLLAEYGWFTPSGQPLQPPLDCEWIWLCHRLNPIVYGRDCEVHYGRILSPASAMPADMATTASTQQLWNERFPEEKYNLDLSQFMYDPEWQHPGLQSQIIQYNLYDAVSRQSTFYYQVSDPHMKDDRFLMAAEQRYKGFLHLFRFTDFKVFIVPTYDVDLMWHSHQLNAEAYGKDITHILGRLLEHDDTDSNRDPGQKLDTGFQQTCELWRKIFGSTYEHAGCMYRGEPPAPKSMSMPPPTEQPSTVIGTTESYVPIAQREVMQVLVNIIQASNVPTSTEGSLRVRMQLARKCSAFKLETSSLRLPRSGSVTWNYKWSFEAELSTAGLVFELLLKRDNALAQAFSGSKKFGKLYVPWEYILSSPTLSSDGWFSLSSYSTKNSPLLCISVSVTPPQAAPQLFRSINTIVTDDKGCMDTSGPGLLARSKGCWITRTVLDHANMEQFIVRTRYSNGQSTFYTRTPEKDKVICIHQGGWEYANSYTPVGTAPARIVATAKQVITGHETMETLSVQRCWSFFEGSNQLTVARALGDPKWNIRPLLQLHGTLQDKITLECGRRLQYEVKGASEDDEGGFVTVARYNPDGGPILNATALFNWRTGAMEVAPGESVILVLLLSNIIAMSVFDMEGEKIRFNNRARPPPRKLPPEDQWGSVTLRKDNTLDKSERSMIPYYSWWYMPAIIWATAFYNPANAVFGASGCGAAGAGGGGACGGSACGGVGCGGGGGGGGGCGGGGGGACGGGGGGGCGGGGGGGGGCGGGGGGGC